GARALGRGGAACALGHWAATMSAPEELLTVLPPSWVLGIVAIAGIALLLFGLLAVLILTLKRRTAEIEALEERLAEVEATVGQAEAARDIARVELDRLVGLADIAGEVWTRRPLAPPPDYAARLADSIPILGLANLKGGVGKTTLSANLAAYFDARGERVLLIDLDYQGSLTGMALGGTTPPRAGGLSGAEQLLQGALPKILPLVGARSNSGVIDAAYPLLNEENRILFRWLLGMTEDDVRYRLAKLLLEPRLQSLYDRVIIDSPPRVTLGLVNALCAATHLLIPTQLNGLSTEAVENFLGTLDALRPHPLPPVQRYRIVGIQKTWSTERLSRAEIAAIAEIDRILESRGEARTLFYRDAVLPNMSGFQRAAGRGLAYQVEPSVRPEIDRLAARVADFAPSYAEPPED
ncbi:MAG: ParA family protein, partial [Pikeienuella sp.]